MALLRHFRRVLRCIALAGSALLLGACAEAGQADDDTGGPDASVSVTPDASEIPTPPDAIPTADADPLPTFDATPVPDAAPGVPDAAPPPDAPPGCTDQVVQLLANANFDSGPGGGWVEQSNYALINDATGLQPAAMTPQSGTHAVWMGGAYDSTDKLYQEVAVPAGATGLQLVGYRWIASEEAGGIFDTVTVQLRSPADAILETLTTWSNSDENAAWTAFTLPATGSYGGQTVRVYLESNTDDVLNTNFFFDTFALRVTVCQ
jgi:hypothetical protein